MKVYTEVKYEWKDGELVETSSKSFDYNGETADCKGGGSPAPPPPKPIAKAQPFANMYAQGIGSLPPTQSVANDLGMPNTLPQPQRTVMPSPVNRQHPLPAPQSPAAMMQPQSRSRTMGRM